MEKTLKNIINIVVLFVLGFTLVAQPVSTASAQDEEILPSGLPVSQLATAIESYVQENEATTAGMAVGVFNRDGILYENYFGYANKKKNLRVDKDTVFEWGSVTKLITWVSVMQLWEQGQLDLNADLRTYLPDTLLADLKYDQPITMLNLMNHNPGFEDVLKGLFTSKLDPDMSLEKILVESEPKQIYPPGKFTAYSNWGATLAAFVVERISGQSFADYVKTNLFQALGMNHTSVFSDMSDNPWVRDQRKETACYTVKATLAPACDFMIPMYPAGAAVGTLEDFIRFGQALLPSSKSASLLFENQATFDTLYSASDVFPKSGLAKNSHGFWVDYYEVVVYGHGGNTAGMSSKLQLDPVSGVGIVVMTNQGAEQVYNAGLEKIVFGQPNVQKHGMPEREIESGVFKPLRTIIHGPMKVYGLQLMAMDNEMLSNAWELDTLEGQTIIRHPIFDLVKISVFELIVTVLLLSAIVLGGLVSLVILIVLGIRALVKRAKPAEASPESAKPNLLRHWRVTGMVLQLFYTLVFVALFYGLLSFITGITVVVAALAAFFLLAFVWQVISFFRHLALLKGAPRERFRTMLLLVVHLLTIAAIFYFQTYQFWAV